MPQLSIIDLMNNNINFYLYTNIAAVILLVGILICSLALENFTFKKISLKHLTVMALFAACSAVLTGITAKIPILGNIRLALGDWILFLIGLIFGPICGVISAISTDTLMAVILPSPYGYHAGYMFGKSLLAFAGALVYLTRSNKRILLKVIVLYSTAYIFQSLFLNQIWMMSWAGVAAWADLLFKLFKLPIVLPIYITITYLAYIPIRKLLEGWNNEYVWCFKSEYKTRNLDY
ncbi:folate family ECF transporter S component [Spiroplasma diminutum]|uniref:Folate family ECF transporter S component n=1 Tax=Spiroplasma diminutum CUAS-1 TaxID=1276221 RepID=S5LYZ8_9MOLU|nr:folate family ECF transporter S component [Spiroplasma diminutum]AGR41771.1 hypothetical protein SDIMI_v3c00670 [Spiroplasma diminutum CUAS-1]